MKKNLEWKHCGRCQTVDYGPWAEKIKQKIAENIIFPTCFLHGRATNM